MPQFVFDSAVSDGATAEDDGQDDTGMGSMIEKAHNVGGREDRPAKRQRVDEDSGSVYKFTGGKGGEISEYIKSVRKEGADLQQPEMESDGSMLGEAPVEGLKHNVTFLDKPSEGNSIPKTVADASTDVVDLTLSECSSSIVLPSRTDPFIGDDEDEAMIIDTKPTQRSEGDATVCYGSLEGAKVSAFKIPAPDRKKVGVSRAFWPTIKCQVQRMPGRGHLIVIVRDAEGTDFGNLDLRTALGLAPLMDNEAFKIRIDARMIPRVRKPFELPGEDTSDTIPLNVILYGQKKHGEAVGKFLSQKNLWLRAPNNRQTQIPYLNPQEQAQLAKPRARPTMFAPRSGFASRSTEEMRSDVLGLFDSLQKSENLPQMEADSRVLTPLLTHQKQALYFMSQHEKAPSSDSVDEDSTSNGNLWKSEIQANGRRVWYNVISGHEQRETPDPVLGGILADMMGLGKTLSILALTSSTLENAEEWADKSPTVRNEYGVEMQNVKTTLLVCPLSVIANWEEQLTTHIGRDALSYYVYHGGNRSQGLEFLSDQDVVVTTYSIVSSEMHNRRTGKANVTSPFMNLNFFRIVLDEAHMIREQTTLVSQSVCALEGSRKWAVTGTPIQNRLDDLGALIKFLRVKPFDLSFAQYILTPFKNADPEILPKLRLLVDSLTLRRLKDKIDLPEREDRIVKLNFSSDERKLYDWFAKDAGNRVKAMGKTKEHKLAGKSYHHILRSIMCLRLISAHGRELLNAEDLKRIEGLSSSNAIDVDDEDDTKPAMTDRMAYEMLSLFQETNTDICARCSKKITAKDVDEERDSVLGTMLPCYQMICNDCCAQAKKEIEAKTQGKQFRCPYCQEVQQVSFFELTQNGLDEAEEAKARAKQNPKHAKMLGRYGGPHTKTTALIADLRDARAESDAHPSQAPIKSVVFSAWTSHLDLIQIALSDNRFLAVRLDGSMSRSQRKTTLDTFASDPAVTVILVSIGAGGLGLNLTAASRVYVMEPQYNPAAEAQAVDRVHRLGQERRVVTTRFVMQDSIEEKMLVLQRKKMDLADLSMGKSGGGKLDRAEAAKRKLEELKSLFR